MQMALMGQAVTVTPFTLMGAMTPTTMAGALAQQNAEALLGIALVQLTKAGAPVVYGGFTSNVDMRSGAPAFGTPENCLANMASGQMARRYNLPYRTSACNASNAVDGQGKQRPLIDCGEADPISCGQYGRSGLKRSACSSSLTHRMS